VEPVWTFLGSYWWLIFPLMGAAGGVAKAWERGARRRHERRLEIIKAKGQLKVARASATAPLTASAAAPADPQPAQLERLFAAHDEVTARWLDYELDVAKLIAFPAMSDGRQPLTAAFLRAKKLADGLRPASAKARLEPAQLAEYRAAVTDYEVAFDVAERDARRLRDSGFSETERRRLDTAKQLLTVAIDQAATPAERQLAYRRVREELDGLIAVSDDAIDVLEKKVALELTTGATDAVRTAGPEAAASPPRAAPTSDAPAPDAPAAPASGQWAVPARDTSAPGRVVRPKRTP
jgi:hypothetical protein